MRNATIKQLRLLRAAARGGSFAAAAEECHLTPPAITRQMQQPEAGAGLPLFERDGRGFALTAAGREVLAAAERIEVVLAGCAAGRRPSPIGLGSGSPMNASISSMPSVRPVTVMPDITRNAGKLSRRAPIGCGSKARRTERFANRLHIRGMEFDLNQSPDTKSIAGISLPTRTQLEPTCFATLKWWTHGIVGELL